MDVILILFVVLIGGWLLISLVEAIFQEFGKYIYRIFFGTIAGIFFSAILDWRHDWFGKGGWTIVIIICVAAVCWFGNKDDNEPRPGNPDNW